MVLTVRCFKCREDDVRLIVGGRSIIHARCHSCGTNLLEEVMEFEAEVIAQAQRDESLHTTAEQQAVETPSEDLSTLNSETSTANVDEST